MDKPIKRWIGFPLCLIRLSVSPWRSFEHGYMLKRLELHLIKKQPKTSTDICMVVAAAV